jgi:FAD/FMN-containing dehydrogenase
VTLAYLQDREAYDLAGFRAAVSGIKLLDDPVTLKRRSRDYYWFSPIAKAALDGKVADLVAVPQSIEDVMQIASAAARHRIPVTVRGLGTGTYGQAVPLYGGLVLDFSEMTEIMQVGLDGFTAQAGAKVDAVEQAARAQGLELRMHPSTKKMATIGGYFCGGSGGIGSVTWGGLREAGNLHGATVVTLEEEPQIVTLRGVETNLVNRTFGSTGIVVDVSAPLEPARPWQDVVAAFANFDEALAYAHDVAANDAIAKRLVSFHVASCAHYLRPLIPGLAEGQCAVLMMIDGRDLEKLDPQPIILCQPSNEREADPKRLPIYEMAWGHTTLHALKQDRNLSYLQTLFPPGRIIETATKMHHTLGDELPMHLEFIRYEGELAANGAQLWPYTSPERLAEIIAIHEDAGVPVANPHIFTVEDGSRHKRVPGDQLAFKAKVDPHGLLNPGKMPSYVPAIP